MLLGYLFNEGGLTNQKLALLGLCIAAAKAAAGSRTMFLPKMYNFSFKSDGLSLRPFDHVFEMDVFSAFLRRWNIELVEDAVPEPSDDRVVRHGWNHFAGVGGQIQRGGKEIVADFFASLIPRIRKSAAFRRIADDVYGMRGVSLSCQMRIEADWEDYATTRLALRIKEPEDYFLSGPDIVRKIVNSGLLDKQDEIFVCCDERHLRQGKEQLRQDVKSATGIDCVFKSDFTEIDFAVHDQLDLSLLDFELARYADSFVGLTRSTFANLLCFERSLAAPGSKADYIYNLPGPTLGRRTDAGLRATPIEATS